METNAPTQATGQDGNGSVSAAPPTHARIEQFKADIAELDLKTPGDANERTLLLVGIGLMVLGGLAILGGYWGASATAIISQQMPYLISGGLLGLGLIVAGGAVFVRYSMSRYLRFWLIREIHEQRAQTDRLVESLAGVEQLLREATRPRAKSD